MVCPICKKKNKLYSINVKDYEYNITNKATYTQCKFCKTIYRTKPTKLNIKGSLFLFLSSYQNLHQISRILKKYFSMGVGVIICPPTTFNV